MRASKVAKDEVTSNVGNTADAMGQAGAKTLKATSGVAVANIDSSTLVNNSTGSTNTVSNGAALPAPAPAAPAPANHTSDAALGLLGLGGVAVNSADAVAGSNVPGSPPTSDVPSA